MSNFTRVSGKFKVSGAFLFLFYFYESTQRRKDDIADGIIILVWNITDVVTILLDLLLTYNYFSYCNY